VLKCPDFLYKPPLPPIPNEWATGFMFPTFVDKELATLYHYKQLTVKEQIGSIVFTLRQSKKVFSLTDRFIIPSRNRCPTTHRFLTKGNWEVKFLLYRSEALTS